MVVLSSSNTRSRSYMTQKMGFAPCCCTYKRSKKRVKMPPKLLFWGRKNEFFSGEGAPPPPQTPLPHPTTSASRPPF